MRRFLRRRYGTVAATAVTVMIVSSGCGVIAGGEELETVVIGADLALTGDSSELGTIYRNAIELRVAQVNEQGLLGDRELVLREVRDNRSDPATSATNVAELAGDAEVAAIITGGCEGCPESAAPVAAEHGIPVIALAASTSVSQPVEERSHVFKLGPNARDTASLLARELAGAGAQTIGMVTVEDQYGEDGRAEMEDAARRNGLTVAVTATVDATEESAEGAAAAIMAYQPEPDLDAQLQQQAQQLGPDAVVLWAYPEQASAVAIQLRAAGYEGSLYLDLVAADRQFLVGDAGEALAGASMIFTKMLVIDEVIATSPAVAARKNWFSDYSARFGTYHAFSSFGADAVQLLVEAINRAGGTERNLLRSWIEATQFEGFTGTILMAPGQHSGLLAQSLVRLDVSGDRWRLGGAASS